MGLIHGVEVRVDPLVHLLLGPPFLEGVVVQASGLPAHEPQEAGLCVNKNIESITLEIRASYNLHLHKAD